jgi:hypothetical protein
LGAKSKNANIYPSYNITVAKEHCYPTKDSFRVADSLAEAKLQDLLHHTISHEIVLAKVAGKIFKRLSWFPNGSSW